MIDERSATRDADGATMRYCAALLLLVSRHQITVVFTGLEKRASSKARLQNRAVESYLICVGKSGGEFSGA